MAAPPDPHIYRRRRIGAIATLGVLITLVILIANQPWKPDEAARKTSAQRATQVAATPTTAPTTGPIAEPAEQAATVTPQPCRPADITVSPSVDQASAVAQNPVEIVLAVSVKAAAPCTWSMSSDTAVMKVNAHEWDRAISGIGNPDSGDVWSSQRCDMAIPVSELLLDPATATPVSVTWLPYPAEGSDETSHYCPGTSKWMEPGKFTVYAAALGGEPSSFDFRLRAQ